jgi:hypothetical protein
MAEEYRCNEIAPDYLKEGGGGALAECRGLLIEGPDRPPHCKHYRCATCGTQWLRSTKFAQYLASGRFNWIKLDQKYVRG